jgi:repressor LexA
MQDKKPLTKRRKEVLNLILKFIAQKGYSPSLREIAGLLGTNNVSTAQYFVDELNSRGYLKKDINNGRAITPISEPSTIPLLGIIAAGAPIEPIENPEEILVPSNINIDKKYPHYALKIKGDSMVDMGILDGDIVLIRHQLCANNGDVIVGVTEKGVTLKVYKKKNGKVYLEARNPKFIPIEPKELEIRGKFVGLIRSNI